MNAPMITLAAVALAIITVLERYEVVPIQPGSASIGAAYRLDRWTGEVTFVHGVTSSRVDSKQ